jgi:hypothetical protein
VSSTAALQSGSTSPSEGYLNSLLAPPDMVDARGYWSLYFNDVDWELGKTIFISKNFILRPHAGIKGAWHHQIFNIQNVGDSYDENGIQTGTNNEFTSLHQREKFWGIGLRLGVNNNWYFNKHFSIYGDLAVSELYGQFYITSKTSNNISSSVGSGNFLTNNIHRLVPVLELALGVRYETDFGFNNHYNFYVKAGWEQQIWWNQNQFLSSVAINPIFNPSGNLMLQGVDLKVGFKF